MQEKNKYERHTERNSQLKEIVEPNLLVGSYAKALRTIFSKSLFYSTKTKNPHFAAVLKVCLKRKMGKKKACTFGQVHVLRKYLFCLAFRERN